MGNDVVIDMTSGVVKAGFAGDTAPMAKFDAEVNGNYAIQLGRVVDWAGYEALLTRAYSALGISPKGTRLLITVAPFNTAADRETAAKVAFDKLGVDGYYVILDAVAALYATGRTEGFVFHSAAGILNGVPIYNGYAMPQAIDQRDLTGNELDNYMITLLAQRGYSVDKPTARGIKEKLCYVALDFEGELSKAQSGGCDASITVNGKTYTLGKERFQCPESLYKPAAFGKSYSGIQTMVTSSILKSDVDARAALYSNLVLVGSTTLLPGFAERFQDEIKKYSPVNANPRVIAEPDRDNLVFKGIGALAKGPAFSSSYITRAQYTTSGPKIVSQVCAQ